MRTALVAVVVGGRCPVGGRGGRGKGVVDLDDIIK
jgi:hypothetical protein